MTNRVLLASMVLLLVSLPLTSWAQSDGVLYGQLVNGTLGGGPVEGLEATLRTFRGTTKDPVRVAAAPADAEGFFVFEGLDTSKDTTYLIQTTYRDVVYSQGMFSFEGMLEHTVQVPVYEPTTSYDGIQVEKAHVFASVEGDSASVSELYVFWNSTDRTYVGSETVEGLRAVSRFLLPDGSTDLAFHDGVLGGRFRAIEGGFVDLEPLWPGRTSVMFGYTVACPAGVCDLDRQVTHPVGSINALIADTGVSVDSTSLSFEGKQQAEGQSYSNYSGHGFLPGDLLDLTIRLPGTEPASPTASGSGGSSLPWIILGSVLTVLALAYPSWRQRVRAEAVREAKSSRERKSGEP